jgi:transposase
MGRTRRRFTREFKLEALRQVMQSGRPQSEVARELGLNPETLYRWSAEFRKDATEAFPGNGNLKDSDKEVEQLRRDNMRLRAENAFLKKVSAYFAKDPK